MPHNTMPYYSSLESLSVPSFDFSFKDFEDTFIFGVQANTMQIYQDDEQSITSSTPRSSLSMDDSDFEGFTPSSSLSSPSPARSIVEPASQFTSSHVSSKWTTQQNLTSSHHKHLSDVLGSNVNNSKSNLPGLSPHRSCSMYEPVRYRALLSTQYRPTIASSPWSCLEDAHHPLCTGGCDTSLVNTLSSTSKIPSSRPSPGHSATMFSVDEFLPNLSFDTFSVRPLRPLHHRCVSAPEHTNLHRQTSDELPPPIPVRNPRRLTMR